MEFILAVLAGLVAGGIGAGAGYVWGLRKGEEKFTKKQETAIKQFGHELKKLIDSVEPNTDDAITTARAIVSVRNSLRNNLTTLTGTLNSDIDALEKLLENESLVVEYRGQIHERLSVLKKTWPSKVTEMDIAVRRLLTELGLYPE